MGHFERGAWIPGPFDRLEKPIIDLIEAFDKFSEITIQTLNDMMASEIFGYFKEGRYISITLKDYLASVNPAPSPSAK